MSTLSRAQLLAGLGASAAALSAPRLARAAGVDRIGVDYAYYNPASLLLKQNGWLEAALAKNGTKVEWVLSLGSNKANEFLAANAVQFGSTAGSAAFLARANGRPIRTVFLYSQPEWTALVVGKNSPLKTVAELKGKRVAATRGTDPWFFLLRSLRDVNLTQRDIELVDLQHPDGRTALERGQVDAWAGLDPHMAASQVDAGSRLLYRNVKYNTYGALNVREDFLHDHPDLVAVVLQQYQRAREYAIAHPGDAVKVLADAAKIELKVADIEVRERTRFPDPTPGPPYHDALRAVAAIVKEEHLATPGADLDAALAAIVDPAPARAAFHA
ncbi:MAG: aliphatic sulfonate ABC transporter substrate-binding protein [Candidatus Velthaea sp.]